MRQDPLSRPHQHIVVPLSCTPSNVFADESLRRRVSKRVPTHRVPRHTNRFRDSPEGHLSSWVSPPPLNRIFPRSRVILRFPERNKDPDFSTFSSLLRVSCNYGMPNLRAQLLEAIRDAYPKNFEGLDPSKTLGEDVFDGPKPHPNAVLNLFVQQKLTSALPMAYYMAVRRGLDSLMDGRLPPSATLSGQTLRSAMRGLMALREMELGEIHRIVFTIKDATNRVSCSSTTCPSRHSKGLLDAETIGAHQRTFYRITRSAAGGTRILQVLSADEFVEDGELGFCRVCAEKMEVGHAEVRRKAWAALPDMFGLKT